MVRRYAVGTAAGAALAMSLAGCMGASGSGKSDAANLSAAQAVALTAKTTGSVSSYKVDVTANGTGRASGTGQGSIQVRLRPSVAAVATLDQAKFGGITVPAGERAILLNNTLYVKVPSQMSQFTGGKPWVKFPLAQAAQRGNLDLNQLLDKADPAQQTKVFTSSKDVHRVGTTTIDGVKTTEYKGTVTAKDAAAQLTGHAKQSLQKMYQNGDAKKITFDLWVGSDNLPRKLVSKFSGQNGSATTTMVYSGYNKPVSVSAPPANFVASADQLSKSFAHGGGMPG